MTDEMKNNNGSHSEDESHTEETAQEEPNPFETFVEKQRLAAEEFTKALEELFPAGFREHTRKAGKAFVESFKVLLDSAREDFEEVVRRNKKARTEEESGDAEDSSGSTKVKVEID